MTIFDVVEKHTDVLPNDYLLAMSWWAAEICPLIQQARKRAGAGWDAMVDCAVVEPQPTWLTSSLYLFVDYIKERCQLRTFKPGELAHSDGEIYKTIDMGEPFNCSVNVKVQVKLL